MLQVILIRSLQFRAWGFEVWGMKWRASNLGFQASRFREQGAVPASVVGSWFSTQKCKTLNPNLQT